MKVSRLNEEASNQSGGGKGYLGHKSYQDYIKNKVSSDEKEIGELTMERQTIADQHMPSMVQKRLFGDLKKLLTCKVQAGSQS